MFKPIQGALAGAGKPASEINDAAVRRAFMVLHGYYGNLFLSKYSTGIVENGEDQGIANARRVWAWSLRGFDLETVKTALARCQATHPEFPPSLPQFASLCAAVKPRAVYVPDSPPALPMSEEARAEHLERHRKAAREAADSIRRRTGSGLDLLKQAIARAVADGGGDEVAELLRLDRILVTQ